MSAEVIWKRSERNEMMRGGATCGEREGGWAAHNTDEWPENGSTETPRAKIEVMRLRRPTRRAAAGESCCSCTPLPGHFVALSSAATFSEEIDELSLAISIC